MNIVAAIIAGLIGTAATSMVMVMEPRMGMPKMAIWELLGSMSDAHGNNALGWMAHFMIGAVFALVYAALCSDGLGAPMLVGVFCLALPTSSSWG